jgi:hypothetical protein
MVQFTADDGPHAYVLEKAQVAALILEARKLLSAVGVQADEKNSRAPDAAVVPEFRISEMHISYAESDELVRIHLIPVTDDVESVEFALTPQQLGSALSAAQVAVEGGRPPCPRCGLAMDPDGHHCPATNGDLRGHRP